jgi:phage terminase small subunit
MKKINTIDAIDEAEKKLNKRIEKQLETKKYNDKITPLQQRFIDNYCSKYGQWSGTQCAINAGYDIKSAHTRASELLDWRKHPDIALEIQGRIAGLREAWDVNRDKHMAMLTKIRDAAMEKGQYGVANKAEELRGKVAGLYIERNLTLTKELTDKDVENKMKEIFPDKESFMRAQRDMLLELFPDAKESDLKDIFNPKKQKDTRPKWDPIDEEYFNKKERDRNNEK